MEKQSKRPENMPRQVKAEKPKLKKEQGGEALPPQQPLTDEEARQCVAVFRFIIPDASIRLAGGRGLLDDKGKECFQSGANAAISGDMLTTAGITVQKDMEMLKDLGYKPQLWED